jgi:hypothetical protein
MMSVCAQGNFGAFVARDFYKPDAEVLAVRIAINFQCFVETASSLLISMCLQTKS